MAEQHDGAAQHTEYAEPIDITPVPGQAPEPVGAGAWTRDDDAPEAEPKRSPRTRRIVLGAVALIALAGLAAAGTAGARILRQKDASLDPPDRLAGLSRDRGSGAAGTSEDLRTALAAGIDLDSTVAAVYTDPASRERSVFFFGGTALLFTPERELDEVLQLVGDSGDGASAMREVPAGELDGVMKCGTLQVPDGTMSACGWADHGSVGVAMFPERTVAEASTLMRELREATETRS